MSKAVFHLEALTCPSCIKKIEVILHKTKGVISAKVVFNSSKVKVEYDSNIVEIQQIKNVLSKIGYPVLSVK